MEADHSSKDVLEMMAKRARPISVVAYRPGDTIVIYCDEAGNIRQRLVAASAYLREGGK